MDNKTFIDTLSLKLDTSRETVITLVNGLASVVGECGTNLDVVTIPAFGIFESRKRPERIAVHPASGKRLLVPPKIIVSFKPSVSLKQKIKRNEQ